MLAQQGSAVDNEDRFNKISAAMEGKNARQNFLRTIEEQWKGVQHARFFGETVDRTLDEALGELEAALKDIDVDSQSIPVELQDTKKKMSEEANAEYALLRTLKRELETLFETVSDVEQGIIAGRYSSENIQTKMDEIVRALEAKIQAVLDRIRNAYDRKIFDTTTRDIPEAQRPKYEDIELRMKNVRKPLESNNPEFARLQAFNEAIDALPENNATKRFVQFLNAAQETYSAALTKIQEEQTKKFRPLEEQMSQKRQSRDEAIGEDNRQKADDIIILYGNIGHTPSEEVIAQLKNSSDAKVFFQTLKDAGFVKPGCVTKVSVVHGHSITLLGDDADKVNIQKIQSQLALRKDNSIPLTPDASMRSQEEIKECIKHMSTAGNKLGIEFVDGEIHSLQTVAQGRIEFTKGSLEAAGKNKEEQPNLNEIAQVWLVTRKGVQNAVNE